MSTLNGSSAATFTGDQSSLSLLQSMLAQMRADLDTLRPDGGAASDEGRAEHGTQGLTGFSVALVSTLARLVHLFKQVGKLQHVRTLSVFCPQSFFMDV